MTKSAPWDNIKKPSHGYNVRLVNEPQAIPLYWGKDTEGNCLFIVELQGDHSRRFQKGRIDIQGLEMDLRAWEDKDERQGLVLKLEQHVDRDLFGSLCDTLAVSLQKATDSAAALSLALTHLKRWKAFLAGKKVRLLTAQEIYGLFSELQFLRILYKGHLSEETALEAWCGPDGGHQDFIFENTAIEIKTLSGKERSVVQISSEDQLETLCDHLFLIIFRLSQQPDSDRALSLNDLVQLMQKEIKDPSISEKLFTKLATCGYIKIHDYDEPKLVVAEQMTYRIKEEFPRIIRSNLADGLMQVSYKIKLEAIATFQCEAKQIWEKS